MSDQEALFQPMHDADYNQRLLSAVTGLTAEMSRASSRDEVLSLVATWVPHIVPADRASIAFPADEDHLSVLALEGNKAIPVGVSLPIAETTTGKAFRDGKTLVVEDTSACTEVDSRKLAENGLVTCINAPMVSQGQVIGTLNVAHAQAGVYTPEHEALLLHAAGVVAAQLNLLDRFFATQDRLETMVADRTRELEAQTVRLQKALEKEKELNGLQRQFVSMVSHEFRTPLAIIDGSAQRMIRRHTTICADRLLDGLGKIRTSVVRLTDLIEAVLSAAQVENGNIQINAQPFDLREAIEEVCRNYQEINADQQFLFELKELPKEVCVDGKLMRQAVSNLVSNAAKYSPDGKRIWIEGRLDDDDHVSISVHDEGPGIPSGELDKLFDRFYRASTSVGIVGTGIGLHIVQVLVELHGGRVDVSSVEGQGSTFSIRFPRTGPVSETLRQAS